MNFIERAWIKTYWRHRDIISQSKREWKQILYVLIFIHVFCWRPFNFTDKPLGRCCCSCCAEREYGVPFFLERYSQCWNTFNFSFQWNSGLIWRVKAVFFMLLGRHGKSGRRRKLESTLCSSLGIQWNLGSLGSRISYLKHTNSNFGTPDWSNRLSTWARFVDKLFGRSPEINFFEKWNFCLSPLVSPFLSAD